MAIKQRSKIWQKSETKWLIVKFGRACCEDNTSYKFTAPQRDSGHIMNQ